LKTAGENKKIFKVIMNECYAFKVLWQKLPVQDLLDKNMCIHNRFPLLIKLNTIAELPSPIIACKRGFSAINIVKEKCDFPVLTGCLKDLLMINMNYINLEDFIQQDP
jgi:hypothetical protein